MAAGARGNCPHSTHGQEAQRNECWAQLTFSFLFSPGLQPTGKKANHLHCRAPPPELHLSRNTPTDSSLTCVATAILNPVKLTVKNNHQTEMLALLAESGRQSRSH